MNDNLKSIINEILEDIDREKPNQLKLIYEEGDLQLEFDGYNYSSYFVEDEEYKIIKSELDKLVLK